VDYKRYNECVFAGYEEVVTLVGSDTENHFASMLFVVNTTMRAGNRNYTWGTGGGHDNNASSTTISLGNRPTGIAAPILRDTGMENNQRMFEIFSFLGVLLGFVV
jgi:hypothetical protein